MMDTIYERIRDSYYEKQPYQGHYQSEAEKIDDTIKSTIGESLLGMIIPQIDPVNSYYNQSKPLLSKLDAYDLTKGASEKAELETYMKGMIIVMNYNTWAVVNAFSNPNNRPTKDEIKSIIQQYDKPPYVFGEGGIHANLWDGIVDKMAQDLIQIQSPSQQDVENIYKSHVIECFYEHAWRLNQEVVVSYKDLPDIVANVKANSAVPLTTDTQYTTLLGDNETSGTIKGYLAVRGDDSAKKTALDALLSNSNLSLGALSQFAGHENIDWSKANEMYPKIIPNGTNVDTLDYTYSQVNDGVEPIDQQAVYDGLAVQVRRVREEALMEGGFLDSTKADTILEEVTAAETSATVKEKVLTVLNTQDDVAEFVQIASGRTLGDRNILVGSTVAETQANIREAIVSSIVGYLGQNVTLTDEQKDALIAVVDGNATASKDEILNYIPDISAEDLTAIATKLSEIKELK